MQRFFSAFPDEWPGAGLLILRLTLTAALVADAMVGLQGPVSSQAIPAVAEILTAALLVLGLWTPIAAIIACLLQLVILVSAGRGIEPPLLRAAMGLSLALLGPGAWSIDARLFGRKRVEFKHHRDD